MMVGASVLRGQGRHDRGVGDAQALDAVHPQARIDHGHGSMPILQVPIGWNTVVA